MLLLLSGGKAKRPVVVEYLGYLLFDTYAVYSLCIQPTESDQMTRER